LIRGPNETCSIDDIVAEQISLEEREKTVKNEELLEKTKELEKKGEYYFRKRNIF
jgi:hypothetical protein